MALPSKERLYFIADEQGRTISISNGIITKNAQPTPLNNHPVQWRDTQISFGTNSKYWSLTRSFSIPLKFVTDGAEILRYYMYKGKGTEEELYLIILAWNSAFVDPDGKEGRHELEYKGRIDMSKFQDDPETGITVNTIEGGLLSYLNANESVTYELDPGKDRVLIDGIPLFDTYNYSFVPFYWGDIPGVSATIVLPVVFFNAEGDSIGIVHGDQTFEEVDNPSYYTTSPNYSFYSVKPLNLRIAGDVNLKYVTPGTPDTGTISILVKTSLGNTHTLVAPTSISTTTVFHFDATIPLAANEKVFIIYQRGTFGPLGVYEILESRFSFSFTSINDPSVSYFYNPLDLGKLLVSKMTDGKYTFDSNYFRANKNVVAAGGEWIREIAGGKLKTSFFDFFDYYNKKFCMCLRIVNEVLWMELRTQRYNDDTVFLDLAEIADLKITPTTEYLVNTVKTGSPIQNYSERNGRYEFNAPVEWKLPVTSVQKELNLITKWREDAYGIEFIRGKLNKLSTTDDKGDNDVFAIDVIRKSITDEITFEFNDANPLVRYSLIIPRIYYDYFWANDTINVSGTASNNGDFKITGFLNISDTQFRIMVNAAVTDEVAPAAVIQVGIYILNRPAYSAITGVPTDTVYNTTLSPKRQLLNWGAYLRSILYQQPGEKITFQTADKNRELSTTLNGVTITEKADVQVSSLGSPLFLPYQFEFRTRTPITFSKVLSQMLAGNIRFTYNGYPLYGLAIGEMSSRPVSQEPQDWKLLASPLNSLETLLRLSEGSLFTTDYTSNMLFVSDYNPVHFVQYDKQLHAKYHHLDMYDEQYPKRNQRYQTQPTYTQKWQTTDTISLQFIAVGLGQLEIHVHNCMAEQVDVIPCDIVADSAVQAPYVKHQVEISLADYESDKYTLTIYASGTPIAISEWQKVDVDYPETYLWEYYHDRNKPDAYFDNWRPMMRIEGFKDTWDFESSSTDYSDEPGNVQILSGETYQKRKLYLGDGLGVPDYVAKKVNKILLLNNVEIDGIKYVKAGESKLETVRRGQSGYPMDYYTVEIRPASNRGGLSVTDSGIEEYYPFAAYSVDMEAFGGVGTKSVEIQED